ncbi:MAG: glycosyltransferase family 4 protein [Candidatus Bathyarchaeota archaeon]|nr:glycosyltransferase family 4 protein [Candidatus Bathyarchaeota archaeon]
MIGYALTDLSRILYGSHIRISELTKNLNIPLIHSRTHTRMLKYLKSMPELWRHKDILLFGSRGRFFDNLSLGILKSHGTRIIYDAADIPHLQNFYFGDGVIDTNLARRFYSLVNLADVLVIISKSALSLFKQDALKSKSVIIVPNASDPSFFNAVPIQTNTKTLLYVGGYAFARGVDDLVAAFNILKKKYSEIKLRLVGANIPLKFKSDRILVEHDKIYKDMPKAHAESYLCIVPHKKNPYMDAALPVKLFDAMASARPVVVTDCVEAKNLVENEKCGLASRDNPRSLAEAIEYLMLNPKVAEEMGTRGREAVLKRHSWKYRAETIECNLKKFQNTSKI